MTVSQRCAVPDKQDSAQRQIYLDACRYRLFQDQGRVFQDQGQGRATGARHPQSRLTGEAVTVVAEQTTSFDVELSISHTTSATRTPLGQRNRTHSATVLPREKPADA